MMAGGSPDHGHAAANMTRELGNLAKGLLCVVYNSDVAVWIASKETHLYPDVSIVCGKPQLSGPKRQQVTNPKLVVEVLSPSTRDYDLSAKLSLYQNLPSLEEYLAMETAKAEIHYWSRDAQGKWSRKKISGKGAALPVRCLGKSLRLADVYEGLV